MAQVTVFTAERMKEIEDTTVVGGLVDVNGNLLLTTREGAEIDAGHVVGPTGPAGLISDATAVGLAPGQPPSVLLGGTPANRTIEFGIPRGDRGLQGDSSLAAGTISLWAGDIAPANWLICDGAAVSRTAYASLFAAIGVKYGAGDGTTTFNVPNLKGRVPIGRDAAQTEFDLLGETGGAKTHTHQHLAPIGLSSNVPYGINVNDSALDGLGKYEFDHIQQVGIGDLPNARLANLEIHRVTSTASSTLPPYQVVNFIIKTTAGETTADSELTTRVGTLEGVMSPITLERRDKINALKAVITGGGLRRVSAAGINWSQRFMWLGAGLDTYSPQGYFEATMPPDGTVIPVYGSTLLNSVTVAAGGIPFPDVWSALYYELPLGQNAASVPGNFRFVEFRGGMSQPVPAHWVLICARNNDSRSPMYTWGDGRAQDYWHPLTLTNGWINYGTPLPTCAWKFSDDGEVRLRGTMKSGALGVFCTTLAGLGPEGFSASTAGQVASIFIASSGTGTARIDVFPNGSLSVLAFNTGGSSAHIALDEVHWYPSDV